MSRQQVLDPIDGYIREISSLLPYPETLKTPVLEELKRDVQDAMGTEKRPPSVVFGSPIDVAKNLSIAQNWGTRSASWGTRFIAFIIDMASLFGVYAIFFIFQLILVDFHIDEIRWYEMRIPFGFLFVGIPMVIFILVYFIIAERTFSTTLGKKLLGLIVVDESGINITWTQSLIRNTTKVPFLASFLPFDFLLGILSEKTRGRKQRVLDFVAGTKVVHQK
ncbi:MAG: RDD family protein [Candidatus Heimdallarchaeota archaeon]|nr:MAG: RDD family protein [Candidatus Heimdallarchaeota archaeon]